ncbi:MAG TPA: PDZ domain-containing protein [Gemmatimonadaceae bacterium]|nr:PDZ domain-containing protein [Gemmatimonadaceae bacterium]
MRRHTIAIALLAAAGIAGVAGAQPTRADSRARAARVITLAGDRDRAMLGVSITTGSDRDTLGILVEDVSKDGPADKAGIKAGDRLLAINGVRLQLDPSDAGDPAMSALLSRRLTRELGEVDAGDEVQLRVRSSGQERTVTVKTVAARDLDQFGAALTRFRRSDRPVLGVSLSATGSVRDSAGLLVVRVAHDGPAERAGIIEGDRIAAVGDVDLALPAEDAGDMYAGSLMMNRYSRLADDLEAGKEVVVRVTNGGRSRTVRITPVMSSELADSGITPMAWPAMAPVAAVRVGAGRMWW